MINNSFLFYIFAQNQDKQKDSLSSQAKTQIMSELNQQYKRIHQKIIALEQLEYSYKRSQANDRKQLLVKLQIAFGVQLTMASLFPSFLIDDSQIRTMENYSQVKMEIQNYNPPSYVAILFFLFLAVKQWYNQPRYYSFEQSRVVAEGALLRYAVSCHIFFFKNHFALTYQLLVGLQRYKIIIEMNLIGKLSIVLYLMLINRLNYEVYNFCRDHLIRQKCCCQIEDQKQFYINLLQNNIRIKKRLQTFKNSYYQNLYRQKQQKKQKVNALINKRAAVIDNLLLRIEKKAKMHQNLPNI